MAREVKAFNNPKVSNILMGNGTFMVLNSIFSKLIQLHQIKYNHTTGNEQQVLKQNQLAQGLYY